MSADYRFELGINWNAIRRPNSQAFLQTAFVDVTNKTSVSPVHLQGGKTVEIMIFDTTFGPLQTDLITPIWMFTELVTDGSAANGPFTSVADQLNPSTTTPTTEQSIAFGGTYNMWDTGLPKEIRSNIIGRFRLTFTISANNKTSTIPMMTWSDDPEIIVGAYG